MINEMRNSKMGNDNQGAKRSEENEKEMKWS